MRIVSLIPSATEIAFALGLGDQVVGVTFECDFPAEARAGRSIVVGGLDTHGLDSAAIDALVRAKVEAGEVLYTLDEPAFRALDADLVLTQDLCRVCALDAGSVDDALVRLSCDADVLTLDPHTVDEVLGTIAAVGAATGTEHRATELVTEFRARSTRVAERVADRARPKVFVLEWPDPPFLAGHWVPELVSAAGGEPVDSRVGERSVPTSWDAIAAAQPDVVIVASCGFDVDGTAAHAAQVMGHLSASAQVWAIDANAVVVRPGPRLIDGIETIAALLHGIAPVDPALARRVR